MKRQKTLMLCLMLAGCMTVNAQQNATEDSIEIGETMLGHTLKARRITHITIPIRDAIRIDNKIYMLTAKDLVCMEVDKLIRE